MKLLRQILIYFAVLFMIIGCKDHNVKVTVINEDGTTLLNMEIKVTTNDEKDPRIGITDSNGIFTITKLNIESYPLVITVRDPESIYFEKRKTFNGSTEMALSITLDYKQTILEGFVGKEDGEGVSNVKIYTRPTTVTTYSTEFGDFRLMSDQFQSDIIYDVITEHKNYEQNSWTNIKVQPNSHYPLGPKFLKLIEAERVKKDTLQVRSQFDDSEVKEDY